MINKMLKSHFVRAMQLAPEQKLPGLLIVVWLIIVWTGKKKALFICSFYVFVFKPSQYVYVEGLVWFKLTESYHILTD